jgi:hypothetical protein
MSEHAATPRRGTDRLAVLTFVLASLWLFGIGSLVALFVGRRSLRRLDAHEEMRGRTLAWAGIAVAIYGIPLAVLSLGLTLTA